MIKKTVLGCVSVCISFLSIDAMAPQLVAQVETTEPANQSAPNSTEFSLEEFWQDQTEANLRWNLLRKEKPQPKTLHPYQVLVFADRGVWSEGAQRIVFQLESQGFQCHVLNLLEFRGLDTSKMKPSRYVIIVPGGNAYLDSLSLGEKGKRNIQKIVADGGQYIGICAGAYLGSKTVNWQQKDYPYGFGFYEGTAEGEIKSIAPWPKKTYTKILTPSDQSSPLHGIVPKVSYYQGGPFFHPVQKKNILATYSDKRPAVIQGEFKDGRFLLIGPHFEMPVVGKKDILKPSAKDRDQNAQAFSKFVSRWLEPKNSRSSKKNTYGPFSLVKAMETNSLGSNCKLSDRHELEKNLRLAVATRSLSKDSGKEPVGIYADLGADSKDVLRIVNQMRKQKQEFRLIFSMNGRLFPNRKFRSIQFPNSKKGLVSSVLQKQFLKDLKKANPNNSWGISNDQPFIRKMVENKDVMSN